MTGWAKELVKNDDLAFRQQFAPIAKELESKVTGILEEIKPAKEGIRAFAEDF